MADSLHRPNDGDAQPSWGQNTPRTAREMVPDEVQSYCTLQRMLFPETKRVLDQVLQFLGSSGFVACGHKGDLSRTDPQMRQVTLACLGLDNGQGGFASKIKITHVPASHNWHVYFMDGSGQTQPHLSIHPSLLLQKVRGMFQ